MIIKVMLLTLVLTIVRSDPVPLKCVERARRLLCQTYFAADFLYCLSLKTILIYEPEELCIHFQNQDTSRCIFSMDGCPMSSSTSTTQSPEKEIPTFKTFSDLFNQPWPKEETSDNKQTTQEPPRPPAEVADGSNKQSVFWFNVTVGLIKYMAMCLTVMVGIIVVIWISYLSKKRVMRTSADLHSRYRVQQARWRLTRPSRQTRGVPGTPPPSPGSGVGVLPKSGPPRPSISSLFQCTNPALDDPIIEVATSSPSTILPSRPLSKPKKPFRKSRMQKMDDLSTDRYEFNRIPRQLPYEEQSQSRRSSIFYGCTTIEETTTSNFQLALQEAKLNLRKTPSTGTRAPVCPRARLGKPEKLETLKRPRLPLSYELRFGLEQFKAERIQEKQKMNTDTEERDREREGERDRERETQPGKTDMGTKQKERKNKQESLV